MVRWRSSFQPQTLPSSPPPHPISSSSRSPPAHPSSIRAPFPQARLPPDFPRGVEYLPRLPSFFKCLSPACPAVVTAGRETERSPRAGDPFQGDKLLTAACLHSWKIKDLWGHEGSACLCKSVTESWGGFSRRLGKRKVPKDEDEPSYMQQERAAQGSISPSNTLKSIAASIQVTPPPPPRLCLHLLPTAPPTSF